MKKSITILLICIGTLPFLRAQEGLEQGNIMVSSGVGFMSLESVAQSLVTSVLTFTGGYTNLTTNASIPLFFKGEYMVSDYVGLGLNVNYSNFKANFKVATIYDGSAEMTRTSILLRGNGHFGKAISNGNTSWDPFIGLGLGYQNIKVSYADNQNLSPDPTFTVPFPLTFETTLGVRYFFVPNVASYLEVGITRALFQIGVTAKF